MYEIKTKVNDKSVKEFIDKVEQPQRREDTYRPLAVYMLINCMILM